MAKKKTTKSSVPYGLQYIPLLLFLFLSLFDIDTKYLLMGAGVLTLIVLRWLFTSPTKVTVLGLSAHTYLLFGGIAALANITPILIIFGSFQEAALFFFIIALSLGLLVKNKKRFGKRNQYVLVASILMFAALLFVAGWLANILAIICFIALWVLEVQKTSNSSKTSSRPLKTKKKHN